MPAGPVLEPPEELGKLLTGRVLPKPPPKPGRLGIGAAPRPCPSPVELMLGLGGRSPAPKVPLGWKLPPPNPAIPAPETGAASCKPELFWNLQTHGMERAQKLITTHCALCRSQFQPTLMVSWPSLLVQPIFPTRFCTGPMPAYSMEPRGHLWTCRWHRLLHQDLQGHL